MMLWAFGIGFAFRTYSCYNEIFLIEHVERVMNMISKVQFKDEQNSDGAFSHF